MSRSHGRLDRLSLRARLTALSVLAVAAALLVGGVLLSVVLTASLTRAAQDSAHASAAEVALLVDTGRVPDPVPVSGVQVIQLLDAQDRVVGGSVTADRLTPLVTPEEKVRALAGEAVVVPGNRTGLSGGLQVAAVAAGPVTGRVTVVAAVPTAEIESSAATLRRLLLVSFPLLLAVLALLSWRLIGLALRPVESLRVGAARIDETSAETERLPVPPTRDEISALATTLNDMLDRVASARRKQRAFVADAAHELRSPLASMHTQLEVAQRLGEGGPLVDDLLTDVQRLAGLVEDLLVLARAEDAGATVVPTELPLAPLLADVLRRYAAARVPVRLAPSTSAGSTATGDGPVVVAVPGDLSRAVGNLVDNAVRHAATQVTVRVWTVGERVELAVEDDGHGIPAAERERVFDRFTRLDEGRDRDSGGSGLGLAITRALLARGGARIRLEDAMPGLRAVITLPAATRRGS
ncbi:ATPase [Intrasporangium oryzae NRRL B-24470]|uniref:histidine kinase n=1 Tax=Intrasporangium oryzae NRRL B-24470 TaxID=1386089 RepID=W9G7J7_9MICO|nr:HAMP domain-containing sensor histidine kinase [Intrasporangium oryzae]EWT01252.1 ATPase [Intrasporangium oryzae NRRL B-24470]